MLKETFGRLCARYTNDTGLVGELWDEIEQAYSEKGRHYHTLQHLENLLLQLSEIRPVLQRWESVLFSLYYHDVVYNSRRSDNEEKSAEFAEKRMRSLSVDEQTIRRSREQILATRSHLISDDPDTNLFTDADLSILGQSWEQYSMYYKNVRREYSIYPDLLYVPGRKKVLKHFLSMDRIFKTDHFYQRFEKQARENIRRELETI